MSIARQLYQLQELDLEIESSEKNLKQLTSKLGESEALINARNKLGQEQKQQDDLKQKQRTIEWEIDDLSAKIKTGDEQLYSGRIRNPKELTALQQEVEMFKAKRDRLETSALELMERVEQSQTRVARANRDFQETEALWRREQAQLSADIENLKNKIAGLNNKRQQLLAQIDPQSIELYSRLKKQKGQAVAKVGQGTCRGCRISLSSSELQRVRSGNLVHCSSCGRILYLP